MKNSWVRYGLIATGGLLVAVLIFSAGVYVGRVTRPGERGSFRLGGPLLFGGSHGSSGIIQNISDQTITVRSRDDSIQTIVVDSQTRIERGRQTISLSDLKIGERILTLGSPDATGQIRARWIRVQERGPATFSIDPPSGNASK